VTRGRVFLRSVKRHRQEWGKAQANLGSHILVLPRRQPRGREGLAKKNKKKKVESLKMTLKFPRSGGIKVLKGGSEAVSKIRRRGSWLYRYGRPESGVMIKDPGGRASGALLAFFPRGAEHGEEAVFISKSKKGCHVLPEARIVTGEVRKWNIPLRGTGLTQHRQDSYHQIEFGQTGLSKKNPLPFITRASF